MLKTLPPVIRRNAVSGPSQGAGLTHTPEHLVAVLLAAAQLSGNSDGQEEAIGADGVGRTK